VKTQAHSHARPPSLTSGRHRHGVSPDRPQPVVSDLLAVGVVAHVRRQNAAEVLQHGHERLLERRRPRARHERPVAHHARRVLVPARGCAGEQGGCRAVSCRALPAEIDSDINQHHLTPQPWPSLDLAKHSQPSTEWVITLSTYYLSHWLSCVGIPTSLPWGSH